MRIAVWTFLASALASLAGTGQTEAAPAPPALFAPPSSSFLQPNIASHPNGIARRSTRSNIAVLDSALLARDPAEITLNLFEGTSLVALRTGGAMNAETGVRIWEGSIEGSDTGSVVITSTNGVVAGSVRTLEGTFNISPLGGLHGIYQLNVSAFPAEGHSKVPERPARQSARQNAGVTGSPRAAPGQVNVIDIMFLVTPAVVQFAAGSEAAALAGINTMIAEANKAYVDGNIPAMLRVVHVEFVNYIEFGDMLVDLNRLTSSDDGFMDNVHYLRDKYRADLVSMLTMDVDLCGMAWTMDSTLIGPDMAEYGFSVVDYSCGASVMSLAHEVGHNMGAAHNRANAGSPGAYPFSYGYQSPNKKWRTIMSYDCNPSCPRIPYFSNPRKLYQGLPLGVAAGVNAADNARTLSDTAAVVAAFRDTVSPVATTTKGPLAPGGKKTTTRYMPKPSPPNSFPIYKPRPVPAEIPTGQACRSLASVIPAGGTLKTTMTVKGNGAMWDFEIGLDLQHTRTRDLTIIINKSGFNVTLYQGEGCSGLLTSRKKISFSEDAPSQPGRSNGGVCTGNALQPSYPFSRLISKNIQGQWTVWIKDSGKGQSGKLFGFCVTARVRGKVSSLGP